MKCLQVTAEVTCAMFNIFLLLLPECSQVATFMTQLPFVPGRRGNSCHFVNILKPQCSAQYVSLFHYWGFLPGISFSTVQLLFLALRPNFILGHPQAGEKLIYCSTCCKVLLTKAIRVYYSWPTTYGELLFLLNVLHLIGCILLISSSILLPPSLNENEENSIRTLNLIRQALHAFTQVSTLSCSTMALSRHVANKLCGNLRECYQDKGWDRNMRPSMAGSFCRAADVFIGQ